MTLSEDTPVALDPGGPPAPRKNPRAGRPARGRLITYVLLVAAVAVTLLPFFWMLLGSVKSDGEILRNPSGFLPQEPTLANYATWFTDLNISMFFVNSLIVAVITVLGNLVFCSMIGYALAKMDFIGKRVLFLLVMLTLMVPGVVTFVPLFVLVTKMGLLNTYPALILPFLTSPLGVFLMRQFFLGLPDDLMDAGRVDGTSELGIFARIMLPLTRPALATLGILTFLGSWNNFLWPLVAAQSEEMYTLPVMLALYSTGESATKYGLLLAGSVLVITPIVVLFVLLQRYFIQSVATAGVK
jgi:multiple sugar transport system permease protein